MNYYQTVCSLTSRILSSVRFRANDSNRLTSPKPFFSPSTDDDLAALYLTAKSQGKPRSADDHEEIELLLESFSKQCEEIVSEVETLSVPFFPFAPSLFSLLDIILMIKRMVKIGKRETYRRYHRVDPRREPK